MYTFLVDNLDKFKPYRKHTTTDGYTLVVFYLKTSKDTIYKSPETLAKEKREVEEKLKAEQTKKEVAGMFNYVGVSKKAEKYKKNKRKHHGFY